MFPTISDLFKSLVNLKTAYKKVREKKQTASTVNLIVIENRAPKPRTEKLTGDEDFSQINAEIASRKRDTAILDAQFTELLLQTNDFIKFVEGDTGVLVAASLAKTIPRLEQRVKELEEAVERKRNWRVNAWLLALTIISTAAAIWAVFIR
jgi:hypothetical protein